MDAFSLPFVYYNSKLYFSALTLSDFILHSHKRPDDLTLYKIIICLSLFKLGFFHRALKFIEYNEEILNFHHIRTLYMKLCSSLDSKKFAFKILKDKKSEDFTIIEDRLNKESI